MLIYSNKLANTPIMSVHAGGVVARLQRPLIDPSNLQIPAFFITRPNSTELEILLLQDIREWTAKGIIIDHDEELVIADELPKLQPIINIDYQLIDKPVYTTSRKKLGTIEEYIIDSNHFGIQKLHVKRHFLKGLTEPSLIIDRKQVVSVNDDDVIVEDASLRGKLKSAVKNVVNSPVPSADPQRYS